MDKVTVILTTYNSANYLQEVLDSINNQEGNSLDFELELIVVDDCSTDNTIDILNKNSVKFIKTPKNTGGPNYGRNLALSQCTGSYICILDHDDIWLPHKINSLLSLSHLAPIITSGYTLIDNIHNRRKDRVKKINDDKNYILYSKNETFLKKLMKRNHGQQTYLGSIMFHASLKDILFETDHGMIDFDWVLRLFYNNSSVELCDSLYLRELNVSNLSLEETYRLNDYQFSLKFISKYEAEFPREVSISKKRINGSLARYYYLTERMSLSRKFFLRSEINYKTILYVITTFVGYKLVKRYFNIFG